MSEDDDDDNDDDEDEETPKKVLHTRLGGCLGGIRICSIFFCIIIFNVF